MTIHDAKMILDNSIRYEIRDHAFGDREITWSTIDGKEVATGYFSGRIKEVYIHGDCFVGLDAIKLSTRGVLGSMERNDETGPDNYQRTNSKRCIG